MARTMSPRHSYGENATSTHQVVCARSACMRRQKALHDASRSHVGTAGRSPAKGSPPFARWSKYVAQSGDIAEECLLTSQVDALPSTEVDASNNVPTSSSQEKRGARSLSPARSPLPRKWMCLMLGRRIGTRLWPRSDEYSSCTVRAVRGSVPCVYRDVHAQIVQQASRSTALHRAPQIS